LENAQLLAGAALKVFCVMAPFSARSRVASRESTLNTTAASPVCVGTAARYVGPLPASTVRPSRVVASMRATRPLFGFVTHTYRPVATGAS
jgi:hypothetical protein